jgi:hypothetical protein
LKDDGRFCLIERGASIRLLDKTALIACLREVEHARALDRQKLIDTVFDEARAGEIVESHGNPKLTRRSGELESFGLTTHLTVII